MRSLSLRAITAGHAPETGEVHVILLEIAHPDLGAEGPIRVCSDAKDTAAFGQTWYAYPFDIVLPDDAEDEPPQVTLTIDNVSREITAAARRLTGRATVSLWIVLASEPDVVQVGPLEFALMSVESDRFQVSGILAYEPVSLEPIPGDSFEPGMFPALFG